MLKAPHLRSFAGARSSLYRPGDAFGISILPLLVNSDVRSTPLRQQVQQRARDHLGGAPQILQHDVFVGALGVALEHRARSRTVDRRRYTRCTIEAHIGVQRRARGGNALPEHRFAVTLQGLYQRRIARVGLPRFGEQQALDLDPYAGSGGGRFGDDAADIRFDLDRVLLRNHAAIEPEYHLARDDIGVGSTVDTADVQIRVGYARHLRSDRPITLVLRV